MAGSISVPTEAARSATARTNWAHRRERTGHPIAQGVAGDDSRLNRRLPRIGDQRRGRILRQVIERQPVDRPDRVADAARLRPDHPETGGGNTGGNAVEILGAAAEGGQQEHGRAMTLCQEFDSGPARARCFAVRPLDAPCPAPVAASLSGLRRQINRPARTGLSQASAA